MTLLWSTFSRLSHKSAPAVTTNMSIDSWCHQLPTQPTRLVRTIEMCSALAAGRDAMGAPVNKTHLHTLLRVCTVPASVEESHDDGDIPGDVLLVERVLSTGGAYHSVTRIPESLSTSGTLFHLEVHDRVCVTVHDGGAKSLARHLEVQRIVTFGARASGGPTQQRRYLTLAQFAQILEFVSRVTTLICAGDRDCRFQSRSFAFTCLAALTPRLPPPTQPARRDGGNRNGVGTSDKCSGSDLADDSVFESGAEMFLGQVPWVVKDPQSIQALRLMVALKDPLAGDVTGLCR